MACQYCGVNDGGKHPQYCPNYFDGSGWPNERASIDIREARDIPDDDKMGWSQLYGASHIPYVWRYEATGGSMPPQHVLDEYRARQKRIFGG